MLKYFLLISMSFGFVQLATAQTGSITGVLKDATDNSPVQGATVELLLQRDSSVVQKAVSSAVGKFVFTGVLVDSFIVTVNSTAYDQYVSFFSLNNTDKVLADVQLNRKSKDLAVVTVVSRAPNVVQKGDTTQFSASQFKVNPDATIEDLIKKMPGITVAKDGTVTAQGEQVKKVTIDGKDFFGDDASAALKNLPSEAVDKIQVYDRQSEQSRLTGFDDGNSVKAINVVTKSGLKNGQFGRAYAGYGTDSRYSAGGNVSFFKGDRRISFVGNFNNINQQNFGSQDLLGLTSSGGRGGGGGGGGSRGYGGGNDFGVGNAAGISKTNAIGINYSNKLNDKMTVTGSYFFNDRTTNNQSQVNTQTLSTPNLFTNQFSQSVAENTNHRINLRLEYNIDSNNTIYIIPNVSFQTNKSNSYSTLRSYFGANDTSQTFAGTNVADRNGYNIGNNILYRHSFPKKGRSVSVGLQNSWTKNDGTFVNNGAYRFFDDLIITDSIQNQFVDNRSDGTRTQVSLSYTEPIGKKSQLQLSYEPSVQKSNADQQTFNYDGAKYSVFDPRFSNKFDNTITTNNGGLTYRLGNSRDNQLSFGVNLQQSKFESQRIYPQASTVKQTFSNILPNASWRQKFGKYSNIRVFYRGYTTFPGINQLQDVLNQNNPLRLTIGNPNLKQTNGNFVATRYSYTNTKTNTSLFANVFFQTATDYISNAIYIARLSDSLIRNNDTLKKNAQLSRPENFNGYNNLRTYLTYSMPLKFIKSNINLNGGFSYQHLPGAINRVLTNTDNFTYSAGAILASNISEYVDFNLNYNATINNTNTTGGTVSNSRFINQAIGVQANLLTKSGWFLQNDVTNQNYKGLSAGLNQNFTLWNAAIGKKFLKNKAGELKLSVFDLLKENQSISREVTGSYIEDSQTQVLQQYFLLTFTYNLKNFGKANAGAGGSDDGGERRGRAGGGRPGF